MTENEYKRELKDNLIKYRASLNLPDDVTFGVEIEYENIPNLNVSYFLDQIKKSDNLCINWINKRESDLTEYNKWGETMNGEINSPILKDRLDDWKNLSAVLKLLNEKNGVITEKCGGHINIGAHILGKNQKHWRNFLLLWILYEKEIYKFSSGEYSTVRKRDDNTIERIAKELKYNIKSILKNYRNVYKYLDNVSNCLFYKCYDLSLDNFNSLNFEINNRIEFRVPNGTLMEEICQNYINFFAKFVIACKKELDVEKVLYKIKNNEHTVLELADYVFDNDIDKEYFLIQTLKTNKIYSKKLQPHIEYVNDGDFETHKYFW